jgi:hypothetical protein
MCAPPVPPVPPKRARFTPGACARQTSGLLLTDPGVHDEGRALHADVLHDARGALSVPEVPLNGALDCALLDDAHHACPLVDQCQEALAPVVAEARVHLLGGEPLSVLSGHELCATGSIQKRVCPVPDIPEAF